MVNEIVYSDRVAYEWEEPKATEEQAIQQFNELFGVMDTETD